MSEGAVATPASRRWLGWLRDYRRDWLRPDLLAGLTTAAVVLPKAMAYATVAGLPVEAGLYTAFVPMVAYALLGSSRSLSVSTTTTIGILTGAELAEVVPGAGPAERAAAAATLAMLVGAVLVLAALLRFGFLANFVSEPVLTGFKAGIGLVIVVDQVPKLLGIHFDKGPFLRNLGQIARHLPETALPTLAVGGLTLLLLLGLEHLLPRVPAPLVAVGGGIAATAWLGLAARGVETVGSVPVGLPGLTAPDPGLVEALWPGAVGIALMSFTETIAAGRAFARGGDPRPDANRELLATGIGNLAGGPFGSMPAGGGTSQSAVNLQAGARSQLAGLVTAGGSVATMLLLAPYIGLMPQATLAAVVIVFSMGLIQLGEFRDILRIRRMEFVWAVAAFAGVVLLGTLRGILFAVVISLLALMVQAANPVVSVLGRKPGTNVFRPLSPEHPGDETFPGLLMVRPEGRVFFANAQRIGERVQAYIGQDRPRVVALDGSAMFDLEYSALKMLVEGEAALRSHGVELWLVGLTPSVLKVVERSPLGRTLGHERMFFDLEQAVARFRGAAPDDGGPKPDAVAGRRV